MFFFLFLFISFYFALFSLVYLISLRFISLGTGRQEFSVRATFSLKVYKFIMKEQKKIVFTWVWAISKQEEGQTLIDSSN